MHFIQTRSTIKGFQAPTLIVLTVYHHLYFFSCLIALVEWYHLPSALEPSQHGFQFSFKTRITSGNSPLECTLPRFFLVCDISRRISLSGSVCHSRHLFRHCWPVDSAIILDILNQGLANTQKTKVRNKPQGVTPARPKQAPEAIEAGSVPAASNNNG